MSALDDFYKYTSDQAKYLGPNYKLTTLKEGEKYKQYLNDILERANGHPIVAFELNKLEEKLKIQLIMLQFFESYKTKKSQTELWNKVKDEFKQIYMDLLFEARRLKEEIVNIRENPRLIPSEWSTPPGFSIINKEDCDGEKSPISREMLKEGEIVKLSDGQCYNLTDLIWLYNSDTPLQSPITRAPFESPEKNLMRTLTLKRRPLGYNGNWNGGRRSRKSRKSRKIKKN
jgi:hypothetical protein